LYGGVAVGNGNGAGNTPNYFERNAVFLNKEISFLLDNLRKVRMSSRALF